MDSARLKYCAPAKHKLNSSGQAPAYFLAVTAAEIPATALGCRIAANGRKPSGSRSPSHCAPNLLAREAQILKIVTEVGQR